MPRTKFRYAVTLEFTEAAPETVRGELTVANARLGARRAVEAAFRAHPNRHWSNLSLLLERPSETGLPKVQEEVTASALSKRPVSEPARR